MSDSVTPQPEAPTRRGIINTAARILLGLLFVLLLVLAGGVVAARIWLMRAMRDSLPQLDGSIHLAGLTAPVTVQRDSHGVPHIRAQKLDDLLFAQGYITAQDRLWQMDMLRRHGAGELAEVLGASLLQHDETQRLLQIRAAADSTTAHMPPDELHQLQVYAQGVNAFISSHMDHLPAEFRVLQYRPKPWVPRDSVLIGMVMVQDLTTGFPTKLGREVLTAKLPPDLLADLYPVGSWRDHPPGQPPVDLTAPHPKVPDVPLDESQIGVAQSDPYRLHDLLKLKKTLALSSSQFLCDGCLAGSNNWAVSGAHTASGKPLLSNDMHLGHTIPEIWYTADLAVMNGDTPGFHVAGVTLPGLPFVIAGHNDHIAWGFTVLGGDVQDLYVEHIANNQYQTADGASHPLNHQKEVIHVRKGADVVLDVAITNHGPIISPMLPHEKRALALQWIIYDPTAISMPFGAVNAATNWKEFCAAFARYGAPSQNVVYADEQGHIGYHALGKIPIRAHDGDSAHPSGLSPTPITDSSYEWTGYIPFDKLPQVYDPPEGIVATANSRTAPDDYPYSITLNWAAPYRNERIWKVLESRQQMKPEDMLTLQTDIYSALDLELAQRFSYAIDHTSHARTRTRQAADILRTWNGNVDKDAAAPAIVSATRAALWPMLLRPHLGDDWQLYSWDESAFVLEEMVMHEPARWLPPGYSDWNALLAAAVEQGLRNAHAPDNLNHWHYGTVHPVDIEHPLFGMSPLLRTVLTVPTGTGELPQSGDTTTVKQVTRNFGPSQRATTDFSNLDNSTLNLVLGESGDPLSPWYHDQWPYWYNGTTFTLPYSNAAVLANTTHTLTLLPQ